MVEGGELWGVRKWIPDAAGITGSGCGMERGGGACGDDRRGREEVGLATEVIVFDSTRTWP